MRVRQLLKPRAFADTEHGYALALIEGSTYPARSTDQGRTWRVDGPALNGPPPTPPTVTAIGAAGANTAMAWGGLEGGSIVAVTIDAGKRWWSASLPGPVLFVSGRGGVIQANVYGVVRQGGVIHNGLWAYQTRTGRRWTFAYDSTPHG